MSYTLPALPYAKTALQPYISAETIEYHYGKHHQAYVNKLNELITNTAFANKSLAEIIQTSSGALFNNAAQAWNHTFYWNCLSPQQQSPSASLEIALKKHFGSQAEFQEQFTKIALNHFGSGWTWLVKTPDDKLTILSTANAENPMTNDNIPLLTCDVWEHAYYIDYRNARAKYLEAFWHMVNWNFVANNYLQISPTGILNTAP